MVVFVPAQSIDLFLGKAWHAISTFRAAHKGRDHVEFLPDRLSQGFNCFGGYLRLFCRFAHLMSHLPVRLGPACLASCTCQLSHSSCVTLKRVCGNETAQPLHFLTASSPTSSVSAVTALFRLACANGPEMRIFFDCWHLFVSICRFDLDYTPSLDFDYQ